MNMTEKTRMNMAEQEAIYTTLMTDALKRGGKPQLEALMKSLALRDLFFLLTVVLKRQDVRHEWLYQRCMDVQAAPDGFLDLWSREHYKSTILSFALTIQDILRNPEVTVGVFSCTRPLAKRLLRQIKFELEGNDTLKRLFPDVLYADPRKESPKWSEDDGIIVKRQTNPAASTVEAWGLVDGQPTGKHFSLMVYDDVVTRESVTTPDMIRKVTEAWELSRNLAAHGGRTRYIGTRYHMNDTYRVIMEREAAIPRIYPATVDGTPDGEPVFLTREQLQTKRREMGPYTFAAQLLQNPTADDAQGFDTAWLKHCRIDSIAGMNLYILVDPAGEKKVTSDYTVMMVVGLGQDDNYYIVDMIRDRLNLTERGKKLMDLHRSYKPTRWRVINRA